jgi:anti-sigma factor RsiW
MNCSTIEQWLSEYVESSLPAEETQIVAKHLETCTRCTALVAEMKSALSACRHYPSLELDPELVERILLRTSGRPRTRSLRDRVNQYFVRPILTPRFAAGAVLAALFLVLMVNVTIPKLKGSVSAMSSQGGAGVH